MKMLASLLSVLLLASTAASTTVGCSPFDWNLKNKCVAFCSGPRTLTKGEESFFGGSWVAGPRTVQIGKEPFDETVFFPHNSTDPLDYEKRVVEALNRGIAEGFSWAQLRAPAYPTGPYTILEGTCGYFTAIPVVQENWYILELSMFER